MPGALTAVLSNMENKHYTEKVLSKIDFLEKFRANTKNETDVAMALIRPNPCEPIKRKDKERKPILDPIVKILETYENLPDKELKVWVELIKI